MPFAAAVSTAANTAEAVRDACDRALAALGGRKPDLAVVCHSPHHAAGPADLPDLLARRISAGCLVGAMGESVVATGREIELAPALCVWLADFGGRVRLDPFHVAAEDTPDGPSLLGLPDALFDADPRRSALLVFGDPYSFPAGELFLPRMNEDYPGMPVMGGMSSGAAAPGERGLILDGRAHADGAVGVLLRDTAGSGPLPWRQVVSQGCRPVGPPFVITKAQDQIIVELGGQVPLKVLRSLYQTLTPGDQKLFETSLHVGLAVTEYGDRQGPGDFLIRNLYGLDPDAGVLAITDSVRVGQTVRFHLRDQASASAELRDLLAADRAAHPAPAAALAFTCNGRGSRMFDAPSHDAKAIESAFGPVPVAGWFAAGEFGPIGGVNFVHGFTASVVLFQG